MLNYPDLSFFIGGDFNSRVGDLNQLDSQLTLDNVNITNERENLDKFVNTRGKELTKCMESNSFMLLNGRTYRDNPAQFTYVSTKG